MALLDKPDFNSIFASNAPEVDQPPEFGDVTQGWDVSRVNNGKPTIKQFNYLQQVTDQKLLWILQNGAALPYDESIEYADGSIVNNDGVLSYSSGGEIVKLFEERTSVNYLADLDSINGKDGQSIVVLNYSQDVSYDSPKLYVYDASSTNDSYTVRNNFVLKHDGYVIPEIWGIGETVNETLLTAAHTYADARGIQLRFISDKVYKFSKQFTFTKKNLYADISTTGKNKAIFDFTSATFQTGQVCGYRLISLADTLGTLTNQLPLDGTFVNDPIFSTVNAGDILLIRNQRLQANKENRGGWAEGDLARVYAADSSGNVELESPLRIQTMLSNSVSGVITEYTDAWNFKLDSAVDDIAYNDMFVRINTSSSSDVMWIWDYDRTTRAVTLDQKWRVGFPDMQVGDTYTLSTYTDVVRYTKSTIRVNNINFIKSLQTGGADTLGTMGIYVGNADRFEVKNCNFIGFSENGIRADHCLGGHIYKCLTYYQSNTNAGVAYELTSTSNVTVEKSESYKCRRCVDVSGVNAYAFSNVVTECVAHGGGYTNDTVGTKMWYPDDLDGLHVQSGFGSHSGAVGTVYKDNKTHGVSNPILLRGVNEFVLNTTCTGAVYRGVSISGGGGHVIDGFHYKDNYSTKGRTAADSYNPKPTTLMMQAIYITTTNMNNDMPNTFLNITCDSLSNSFIYLNNGDTRNNSTPILRFGNCTAMITADSSLSNTVFSFFRAQRSLAIFSNIIDLGGNYIINNAAGYTTVSRGALNTSSGLILNAGNIVNLDTKSYALAIADDSVTKIPDLFNTFSAKVSLHPSNVSSTLAYYADNLLIRAGTATSFIGTKSTNVEVVATALTGTTGTDGSISISMVAGVFYIENRTGSTIYPIVTITGA